MVAAGGARHGRTKGDNPRAASRNARKWWETAAAKHRVGQRPYLAVEVLPDALYDGDDVLREASTTITQRGDSVRHGAGIFDDVLEGRPLGAAQQRLSAAREDEGDATPIRGSLGAYGPRSHGAGRAGGCSTASRPVPSAQKEPQHGCLSKEDTCLARGHGATSPPCHGSVLSHPQLRCPTEHTHASAWNYHLYKFLASSIKFSATESAPVHTACLFCCVRRAC